MNTLRLYTAFSCLFLFLSCVENEIEIFDVTIDIQPQGSAGIEPEVYGPFFPGDSISITITPHQDYHFDQWSGSVSYFESTITLFGTKDHRLTASLVETPELTDLVLVYNGARIDPNPIFAVRLGAKSSVVLNKQGETVSEYEFEKYFSSSTRDQSVEYCRKANINPSLLRQYKTGKAKASEEQAKKVLNAMHELGKELLSVSF